MNAALTSPNGLDLAFAALAPKYRWNVEPKLKRALRLRVRALAPVRMSNEPELP